MLIRAQRRHLDDASNWLVMLRAQMKLGRARTMRVPLGLVRLVVGSDTLGMLVRGNTADASSMERILRRSARDAADFVKTEEAHLLAVRARVTGPLPVIRAAVAATWIFSGIVSLGLYPVQDSKAVAQYAFEFLHVRYEYRSQRSHLRLRGARNRSIRGGRWPSVDHAVA